MISIDMATPQEVLKKIAENAKAKRLSFNFTQQTLSAKSGVSYGALKKFERTGQISLESLLKIALVLGALNDFADLFKPRRPEETLTLDELMQQGQRKKRKRGRK